MLNGEEPLAAMRRSFRACARNIVPFLVYGLIYLGLAIVATHSARARLAGARADDRRQLLCRLAHDLRLVRLVPVLAVADVHDERRAQARHP